MYLPKLTPSGSKFALSLLSSLVLLGCTTSEPQTLKRVSIAPSERQDNVTLVAESQRQQQTSMAQRGISESVRSAPLLRMQDTQKQQTNKVDLPREDVTLNAD